MIRAMNKTLSDYVDITTGRSFRAAIEASATSTHKVIQIGDVVENGGDYQVDYSRLIGVDLSAARAIETLSSESLLMIAKGAIKPVITMDNVVQNVICTQHFLVLTPNSNTVQITTQFIKAYLSSDFARGWIESHSGGNYQSTLSKTVLSKLPVPDLNCAKGNLFIDFVISVEEEMNCYRKIMTGRKQQMDRAIQLLLGANFDEQ